jgi:hypothetical protein
MRSREKPTLNKNVMKVASYDNAEIWSMVNAREAGQTCEEK